MPEPREALSAALESWNAGDLDGYLRLYDEGIRLHGYSPAPMDKAQVRGFYAAIFSAFDTPKLARRDQREAARMSDGVSAAMATLTGSRPGRAVTIRTMASSSPALSRANAAGAGPAGP
jgi:SnoaL-like domain